MTNLLIGTSGCGGGSGGPNGVYHYMGKYLEDFNMQVYSIDTIPDDVEPNVSLISDVILENLDNYKNFYLAGWSMGGATAIKVAHYINNIIGINRVKGIVLLATQGAEMDDIDNLKIPILFIHGNNDRVLSHKISERLHKEYKYRKKLIILDKLGHNFMQDANKFAEFVSYEIVDIFNLDHKNFVYARK